MREKSTPRPDVSQKTSMKLRTQGKFAIAGATVVTTAVVIFLLKKLAPEADETEREAALPTVQVMEVESTSTAIEIASQGVIEAPTETSLAAEVGGTIIAVSEKFEVGQDLQKDDVLLEIDPADYASALAQAEANVATAELNVALEQGQALRVKRDWESGILKGDPSDLALRKPQLKSAEAALASAKAAVAKAKRDLERTKIRAPYDCRIRATHSEIGSFLAPGARIADIYERGRFEIRLPIPLDDYAFIDSSGIGASVTFSANIGGEEQTWSGTIIRSEGVIDRNSRSIYLVAQVETEAENKFLSPGLFVKAVIDGRELENVVSLPRKALYGKDRVYVIDENEQLQFRTVTVARTERDRVLISKGLEAGESVAVTNLAAAIDQMKVRIIGDEKAEEEKDDETGGNDATKSEKDS